MFESVLLPAPFSPSSACTSPGAASNETLSFASTPGKRFVMSCIETAGGAPGSPALLPAVTEPGARSPNGLARRRDVGDGPLHALHQPLHGVERVDPRLRLRVQTGALGDLHGAGLVVDRAAELVPLAGDKQRLLRRDRRLRLCRHARAVRSERGEAV